MKRSSFLDERFFKLRHVSRILGISKKLKGFKHQGIHITVNTIRELEDAEEYIHEFAEK